MNRVIRETNEKVNKSCTCKEGSLIQGNPSWKKTRENMEVTPQLKC